MKIEIISQTEKSIDVKVDYNDKDEFKNLFKDARWVSEKKVWRIKNTEIAVEKITQLNKAYEESGVEALENEVKDIVTLRQDLEKEIGYYKVQLENTKMELEAKLKKEISIEKFQKSLEDIKELLGKVKAEYEAASARCEAKKDEIRKTVSTLIDVERAKEIHYELIKLYRQSFFYAEDKRTISEYQNELTKIRKPLKNNNLELPAIEYLINMNSNRPDRDNPNNVLPRHWLALKKIENKEE